MKFYMHAGSLNHGCEAIVRATVNMTREKVELYSEHPEEDCAVGLDKICSVKHQGHSRNKKDIGFIVTKGLETLFHTDVKFNYLYKNILGDAKAGDVYVSIGGDNYCYGNNPNLFFLNRKLNEKGCQTVLWGCSIEPDTLSDQAMVEDLKKYKRISARETITYQALIDAGLDREKVFLYPDPAFTLAAKECAMPKEIQGKDLVGINLSPLVDKLDSSGGMVYENYKHLIRYILDSTDFMIALIPHVCKPGNDDRVTMKRLMKDFPGEGRIVMLNQEGTETCEELKYMISKCRFMITARTHASIAAYSKRVPTLVVGYSVKAKGIAKDIFGSYDGMVVDISEMKDTEMLKEAFSHILEDEEKIKNRLNDMMPQYIQKASDAKELLESR